MNDAADYSVHETLRDGTSFLIRAIRPDDRERLLRHSKELSPASIHSRFLGVKRELTESDLDRFTQLDFDRHVGLAATIGTGADERFIAIGRYIRRHHLRPEDAHDAEVAFTVVDQYQGRGFGSLLLKHLAIIASRCGITGFVADVLGSNQQMLQVFANSGFQVQDSYQDGIVRVTLTLTPRGASAPTR